MTDYRQAREVITQMAVKLKTETLPVFESAGFILAKDIRADIEMPRFNKSAMDGIAVRYDDLSEHTRFPVLGNIMAGSFFEGTPQPGTCVKIMTGAPVPSFYDTVIRREYLDGYETGKTIQIMKEEKKGSNIAWQGEDFHKGNILVEAGSVITPFTAGTMATAGVTQVAVYARPNVLFFSTGDEVYEPDEELPLSGIRNANASSVMAALHQKGFPAAYGGIARDTRKTLEKAIEQGEKTADVIVFSGGVSEGDLDLIPELIKERGYTILWHKLNVKPGKPQLLARKGDTFIMGLPGNPVSTALSLYLFLLPLLKRLSGHRDLFPRLFQGSLPRDVKRLKDRHHFIPVRVVEEGEDFELIPVPSNGSGDIHAAALADGFARIPHESESYKSKHTEFFFIHE
jgi:molybdopterin molybdotransferase